MSPASDGQVTGSGSFTEGNTTVSFYGSDPFQLLTRAEIDAGGLSPGGDASTFGGFVNLDPEAGQAHVCFSMLGSVHTRTESDGGTFETKTQAIVPPIELFDGVVDGLPCLFLPLSSSYAIPSGSTDFTVESTSIKLEWTTFDPTSPPGADTPA